MSLDWSTTNTLLPRALIVQPLASSATTLQVGAPEGVAQAFVLADCLIRPSLLRWSAATELESVDAYTFAPSDEAVTEIALPSARPSWQLPIGVSDTQLKKPPAAAGSTSTPSELAASAVTLPLPGLATYTVLPLGESLRSHGLIIACAARHDPLLAAMQPSKPVFCVSVPFGWRVNVATASEPVATTHTVSPFGLTATSFGATKAVAPAHVAVAAPSWMQPALPAFCVSAPVLGSRS